MNVGRTLFSQVMEYCSVEDIRTNHQTSQRRLRCSHLELRRAVSCYSFLAVDVAGIFARYRGLLDGQPKQTVSYGPCLCASPVYSFGCPEPAGLADLPRIGHAVDCPSARFVCRGANRLGTRCNGLRAGFDNRRLVFVPFRPGAVSLDQGRSENAHVAGPAGQHPDLRSTSAMARWATSRCSISCPSKQALFT